ncbi:MAG: hypothetical protein E6R03_14160 [Hyphomicrobiaceae bacterium]|nr:MAG: hypothetical protein E6R03_14160 [Hyphomicrobiaceae bacterium]
MTTQTTDLSEEIMPAILRHLKGFKAVTDKLGRTPCKLFPGDVPPEVDHIAIKPPWVNLERGAWSEEMHFGGGTGCFICPTTVVVVAQTIKSASEIYATIRFPLNGKFSETWGNRLWIGESQMSLGQQVPLLEADGSPSQWQQIVGELYVQCTVLPVSD